MFMGDGDFNWYIADAYLPSDGDPRLPSHEAICILNTSEKVAKIKLSLYFDDGRPPIKSIEVTVSAESSAHLRTDKPDQIGNVIIPYDVPYGIKIESDTKIIVQYSRANTGKIPMALMTTIAFTGVK